MFVHTLRAREDALREDQKQLAWGKNNMQTFVDEMTELDEVYKRDAAILVNNLAYEEEQEEADCHMRSR
jgi:hypothetical protein